MGNRKQEAWIEVTGRKWIEFRDELNTTSLKQHSLSFTFKKTLKFDQISSKILKAIYSKLVQLENVLKLGTFDEK